MNASQLSSLAIQSIRAQRHLQLVTSWRIQTRTATTAARQLPPVRLDARESGQLKLPETARTSLSSSPSSPLPLKLILLFSSRATAAPADVRPLPKIPIHAPIPHLSYSPTDHTTWTHLFSLRTRWIVHQLARGTPIPPQILSKLIAHRSVTQVELDLWVDVLAKRDLVSGLERLGLLDSVATSSSGEGEEGIRTPNWLICALPALVKDRKEVPYLIGLLLSKRVGKMPKQDLGLLVARINQHCLRVGHYVASREIIDWFCSESRDTPQPPHLPSSSSSSPSFATPLRSNPTQTDPIRTYTRLLNSLTLSPLKSTNLISPTHPFLKSLSHKILSTFTRRSPATRPTLELYLPQFHPALIPNTREGALELLRRFKEDGFEVRRTQLKAILRVFAKMGRGEGSGELLRIVRDLGREGLIGPEVVLEFEEEEGSTASSSLEGREQEEERTRTKLEEIQELEERMLEDGKRGLSEEEDDLDGKKRYYDTSETTYLHSLSKNPLDALLYFQKLRYGNGGVDGGVPNVDRISWLVLFKIISRSKKISAEQLSSSFDSLLEASGEEGGRVWGRYKPPRPSKEIWHVVMAGLLDRNKPEEVLELWEALQSRLNRSQDRREGELELDSRMVDVVARAYYSMGDLQRGERLLLHYFSTAPTRKSTKLDIVPLNNLLMAYNRQNDYDSFFRVWTTLSSQFDVSPDSATISILLDTARYASAAAGNGYGPGAEHIESAFGGYDRRWEANEPWAYAQRVVKAILTENWPEAEESGAIVSPLEGHGGGMSWGKIERWWTTPSNRQSNPTNPFSATLSPDSIRYPQVIPSARMFRSYFQLLGYHATPHTVARALAWSRYLDIKPTRNTLTLVMMYIGEGAPTRQEEENLRKWLADWLGRENVPREDEIAAMRSRRR